MDSLGQGKEVMGGVGGSQWWEKGTKVILSMIKHYLENVSIYAEFSFDNIYVL